MSDIRVPVGARPTGIRRAPPISRREAPRLSACRRGGPRSQIAMRRSAPSWPGSRGEPSCPTWPFRWSSCTAGQHPSRRGVHGSGRTSDGPGRHRATRPAVRRAPEQALAGVRVPGSPGSENQVRHPGHRCRPTWHRPRPPRRSHLVEHRRFLVLCPRRGCSHNPIQRGQAGSSDRRSHRKAGARAQYRPDYHHIVILRCTSRMLDVICGKPELVDVEPSVQDWYANVVYIDGKKCVLLVQTAPCSPA
jgi:hypothetical protein